MKSFFEDLRNQSILIRSVMFGLCVVIAVSMVGVFWFRSLEEQLFISLNQDQERQEAFYAQREESEETIFANIGSIWTGLTATIGSVFDVFGSSNVEINSSDNDPVNVYEFPISE